MDEIANPAPCAKCGAAIYAEARFCPGCGTQVLAADGAERSRAERSRVVKAFVRGALRSADYTARELMKNETAQKVAGGAALGAGIAVIVPLLTIPVGATLGAAFVGYKLLTKD
jgi:hypothetical protein